MKQTLLKDIELDIEQLKCLVKAMDNSYNPVLFEAVKRNIVQMQGRLDLLCMELNNMHDSNHLVREEEKEPDSEASVKELTDSSVYLVSQEKNTDDSNFSENRENTLNGEESFFQEQLAQNIKEEIREEEIKIALELGVAGELAQEEAIKDNNTVSVEDKNKKELSEKTAEIIEKQEKREEDIKIALEVASIGETMPEKSNEEFEGYGDENEEDNYQDEDNENEAEDEYEDEEQLIPLTDEALYKIAEERKAPYREKQSISEPKYVPVSDVLRGDIRQFITLNDTFRFTRELFEGNNDKMKETVAHLNSLNSFEEALTYMETLMPIEDENEAVQDFIDIIRKRFNR